MPRTSHGHIASLTEVNNALNSFRETLRELGLGSAPIRFAELTDFDYMFPQLQDGPDALLPASQRTVTDLTALGLTMSERDDVPGTDSSIPSAYTYFGQFVDHDITQELRSERIVSLDDPDLAPLPPRVIEDAIKNTRTPTLDLDCVYGATAEGDPVPRHREFLAVGAVSPSGNRLWRKGGENDVPRMPRSGDPRTDRKAKIGDARNDEHFIISQLHVSFLRAHYNLVARGHTFDEARTLLRQHYQWVAIHDYLKRVADVEVVNDILTHGNRFFRPPAFGLYMPLEFSVAAFRFGHSMVRDRYHYNDNYQGETAAPLEQLFTPAAFRGWLKEFDTLPESMIIQWEKFLDGGRNKARRIDTRLVEPLYRLRGVDGHVFEGRRASLAVRNLLRGYVLRIPTGQAVARTLGLRSLSERDIEQVALSADAKQAEVMHESGFLKRTPLWYYILAEAAAGPAFGSALGPVGSTIVAEVLIGMVRRSEDSILCRPGWKPTLGPTPGQFTLRDLFSLAEPWGRDYQSNK